MATSWMIVEEDGQRRPVDVRSMTTEGVRRACRRAQKTGKKVIAGYRGGPYAIALSPQVFPKRPA